jgi:cytochrome c peroxidase
VRKRPARQRPDRSGPQTALRVLFAAALLAGAAGAQAGDLTVPLPAHVLAPLAPEASGALTTEKVELGKKLYFERKLSADDTVSCATCHDPRHGFAEPRPVSIGVGGRKGVRNAPSAFDAAFLGLQFWDGRVPTLEEQATGPIVNPLEMAMPSSDAAVAKIAALPDYKPLFSAAFGDESVTMDRIAIAIASFERTLVDVEAPIDRFVAGDQKAISESAKRGWDLYNGKARCNNCHGYVASFPLMTDELFHNIGVAAKDVNFEQLARHVSANPDSFTDLAHTQGVTELGRFIVTKEYKDIGAFKTPQLRNVALTPPYMHNGSEATLEAVIEFYDKGGNPNPWLDGGMRPLSLTAQEKADLVEVMKAFTSDGMARFAPLAELMPR